MPVTKIKNSPYWYVRFTAPDGRRIFRSTRTANKSDAERYENQLRRDLWRKEKLGESQTIWQQAVVSWLRSTEHKSRKTIQIRLRWLDKHLKDTLLTEIKTDLLHDIREYKLREGAKPATANRSLSIVSAVLNHAKKRGWIQSVPNIPTTKEKERRLRYLSRSEAESLLNILRGRPRSQHLADMVQFSLATGLRESNVTGLLWEWLEIGSRVAWIPSDRTKNNKPLRVPLNSSALDVLKRRKDVHPAHVFSYRGKPLRKAGHDGFKSAVEECGWDDVT